MTRDDIIRIAREAGMSVTAPSWGYTENYHFASYEDKLERFAALVAAKEREEWTKALDAEMVSCHLGVFNAEDDPRAAIAKLLAWHQDVALDPAVSSRAQELILKEREACAVAAWSEGMDAHNAAIGIPCDAREVGSRCAAAIRARGMK